MSDRDALRSEIITGPAKHRSLRFPLPHPILPVAITMACASRNLQRFCCLGPGAAGSNDAPSQE